MGQVNLGYYYHHGIVVARDYKEAARLFRLAADQQEPEAEFNLGLCYEKGYGVNRDLDEAIWLYQLAASQGNDKAKNALRRLGRASDPEGHDERQ